MADETLYDVIRQGDRAKSLAVLRDHLAVRLEWAVDGKEAAAVSKQLTDVMRELEKIEPAKEATSIDDLAARRSARREDAAASKRTPSGEQRRTGSRRSGKSSRSGS